MWQLRSWPRSRSKKYQDSERDLAAELARLPAELEKERKQKTEEITDGRHGLKEPQINISTFLLTSTRGSDPTSVTEIIVPRSPTDFLISVSLEGEKDHSEYRMTILDDRKTVIFKRDGFKRDPYNSLSAKFNSTFFRPGDYSLTVDGVAGDGSTSVVGTYSFRVVKTP